MHKKDSACRFALIAFGLLACSLSSAHASVYDVGPSKPYTTLGAVPWTKLAPGDTVNIYWQSQPYRECILLSQSGTANQHIVVNGIPDPATGKLPVIDGQNAVQSSNLHYHDEASGSPILYKLGVVMVSPTKGSTWGYIPSYIDIQNLVIQNADQSNRFTAWNGVQTNFHFFASSIYVEFAQHLTIHNCTLTGSGNGLFINSKFGGGGVSQDILVDGNQVYGNGVVGSFGTHNIYTEAIGTVFQFNQIGSLRSGALGCALKDRSAGTVIRYNWIEGGGHCIDLVETQGGQGAIDLDPSYRKTFVYGNVIHNDPTGATTMIHYGGDQYAYQYYRKGTLYFYNNTVINQVNQVGTASRYYTMLFYLPTLAETGGAAVQETVDCRNNVIYNIPQTTGKAPSDFYLLSTDGTGTLNLGVNWSSPGVLPHSLPYNAPFIGTVNGMANLIIDPLNNPGFNDFAHLDLSPTASSPLVNASGPLAAAAAGIYNVLFEYNAPTGGMPRPVVGTMDLGAFEFAGATVLYSISGNVTDTQGVCIPNVQVSAGSFQTVTDSNGNYLLASLPAGTYSVSASATGYSFSAPRVKTVGPSVQNLHLLGFAIKNLLTSIDVHQATLKGGQSTWGHVGLSQLAPAGGLPVTLSSSDPCVQVPAILTIPQNWQDCSYTLTTTTVTMTKTVTITAQQGSVTKTVTVTVTP